MRYATERRQTWKISKPAMSRMPMNVAPGRLLRSSVRLMRRTSQRKRRSYSAFVMASSANSTCSFVCDLFTNSRPTFRRGFRNAGTSVVTCRPSRWHTFCATTHPQNTVHIFLTRLSNIIFTLTLSLSLGCDGNQRSSSHHVLLWIQEITSYKPYTVISRLLRLRTITTER